MEKYFYRLGFQQELPQIAQIAGPERYIEAHVWTDDPIVNRIRDLGY